MNSSWSYGLDLVENFHVSHISLSLNTFLLFYLRFETQKSCSRDLCVQFYVIGFFSDSALLFGFLLLFHFDSLILATNNT